MASLTLRRGTLRVDTLRGADVTLVSDSDAGASADDAVIIVLIVVSDSGIGVDDTTGIPGLPISGDTGVGAEDSPIIIVILSGSDSAFGDDSNSQAVTPSTETGSGTETVVIHITDAESVTGLDSVTNAMTVLSSSDLSTALDALLRRSFILVESAIANDAATTAHSNQNVYVGGLRARLIRDSLFNMVKTGLTDLDWFDPGRQHAPINWRESEVANSEEIPLNTIALSDADTHTVDWELGSDMAEHNWVFFIDFYAEDSAIGIHLIRDVKDILEGRFPSISRIAPVFTVYDYTISGTPPPIFTCEIENVDVDKAHVFSKPWQKHWYAISLTVVDYYGNEQDQ